MYGSRISRRPGSEREVRAEHENPLSNSQAYNPQNEEGRYSQPSQIKASGQELERNIFRPRPCLTVARRFVFPCQLRIGQAVSRNTAHSFCESYSVRQLVSVLIFPIVESECLLIHITEQVERFYADVSACQFSLQAAPKVLDSLRVNCAINVLLEMVHDLVRVVRGDRRGISYVLICVNQRTCINRVEDSCTERVLL